MNFIKRYGFLIITNLLVTFSLYIVANIVMSVLGIQFNQTSGVVIFYFILGMGGSFFSLMTSKWMAKKFMNLQPSRDSFLNNRVQEIARSAGLKTPPEVYIYDSQEINAFATGPSSSNSLVAVSTGLLRQMNQDELEGVLAHEVAHIANGDMVTMTLVQGIVQSIAMVLSFFISNAIMNFLRGDDDDARGMGSFFMEMMIRQVIFSILSFLGLPVISYVSRWREYRADAGSAKLVGTEKMTAALQALQRNSNFFQKKDPSMEVMAINGKTGGSFAELFMSHPPLDKRIDALRKYQHR